jgi:hypothetical protein
MYNIIEQLVMPARIIENVRIRNGSQAAPGGVAGSGRAWLRRSPICKKQPGGLCQLQAMELKSSGAGRCGRQWSCTVALLANLPRSCSKIFETLARFTMCITT